MLNFFIIAPILFFAPASMSVDQPSVPLNRSCKKDSDCVLYKTSCKDLIATHKNSITGEDTYLSDNKIWVSKKTLDGICLHIVPPQWQPDPVAKCIKKTCKVKSKKKH